MNDNPDFWPMWGALATAASAIATFMAAFVALWQSKLTLKKNIKVELKNAHTLPELKYYLEIDISNHGQKDIVIESWSWEFRDKGTVFIPNGLCRCIALGDIVALPFVLKSENNLKIMLPIEHLIIILPYTTVYFEYHALGAIIYMKTTEILTSINAFMVAIKSMVGSSGRQRVQQDVLENLELVLPDYETQVRVGKVLSAFDDKIELNTQIKHNLEGIAA